MRIAVVDVETTGFSPRRGDRVLEIAIIGLTDGQITDEFSSLVNPQRDVGATHVHGITAEDVYSAPTFSDLAGDLMERLDGSVTIAAHNARFDHQFLLAEFDRAGVALPEIEAICTMGLGGGSLSYCCSKFGLPEPSEAHTALDDARASARILANCIERVAAVRQGKVPHWPKLPKSGRAAVTRTEMRIRTATNPYLERLTQLAETNRDGRQFVGEGMAYLALLGRVMEDRRIDDDEGAALIEAAQSWGLSLSEIDTLHTEFLRGLAAAALLDGVVTDAERKDLGVVCKLLGRPTGELDQALSLAEGRIQRSTAPAVGSDLTGKSVCFTGELLSSIGGQPISREDAQILAARAGLEVKPSVTKKLDVLVVADPHTRSGKAEKARQYGTRIMAEPVFWKAIGVSVD